jgi:DNA-binding HxlR family transcriptional regulator
MSQYQQFCPVALAAEIITRSWMPLVIRELLCGSTRFNDIHRGVPKMSRTLLSRRLEELIRADLVERRLVADGRPEYHLTPAGEELRPIIEQLGVWGRRWVRTDPASAGRDPRLLMWDVRRRIVRDRLPDCRVVVWFHFPDAPRDLRSYWLILQPGDVDLCYRDPGFEVDLAVTSPLRTMIDAWMGDVDLGRAIRSGEIELRGPRELRRRFPAWLGSDSSRSGAGGSGTPMSGARRIATNAVTAVSARHA